MKGAASPQGIAARGFSLIELLVVMAMVAILMALTVAGLSGILRGASLASEAEGIAEVLREARGHAMGHNTVVEILFEDAENSAQGSVKRVRIQRHPSVWSYRQLLGADGTGVPEGEDPWGQSTVRLDRTVIGDPPENFAFFPNGSVRRGGIPVRVVEFTLRLEAEPDSPNFARIVLNGLTGLPEVVRPGETHSGTETP